MLSSLFVFSRRTVPRLVRRSRDHTQFEARALSDCDIALTHSREYVFAARRRTSPPRACTRSRRAASSSSPPTTRSSRRYAACPTAHAHPGHLCPRIPLTLFACTRIPVCADLGERGEAPDGRHRGTCLLGVQIRATVCKCAVRLRLTARSCTVAARR